ncbi:unnamed protein product [Bursaphelenchus xylophilus]|uniref:DNA polymerase n=1 Tax=Bursaphelenchus xylophilus TaxID=6326 RepID=A0A7I8WWA9_BURXY|nr:unnamed protein product [Bursaphelenchus xylophilus]CAG9098243.1 unnamed protein product [Bursaphelenchus xylophilus]
MPFDLADALKNKRSDLKSVTTKVISIDGTESEERRGKDGTFEEVDLLGDINEDGEEVTVSNRRRKKVERAKKMGFVVDLKPDLQVAEAAANVFLGSQDVAADFQLLKRHGITAIVNAAAGVANLYPKNFDYLRVELLDLPETDILKELPAVLRFIYDNVNSGGRVLVHCNAGVSRAASIVLAYMINFMLSEYRICNVSCDYYLSEQTPYSAGNRSELPVIRVFGIDKNGQKCCAHIHGTSPCIWMRTNCQLSSSQRLLLSQTLSQRLQNAGIQLRADPIIEISECKARSMYGYYDNKDYFIRISLRNPVHTRTLTKILQGEALHDFKLQPYMSHIPFILQFFIEYSIFGMGQIGFRKVLFRKAPNSSSGYNLSSLPPASNMSVEFDAHVEDILNPWEEVNCKYINSGLEYIWNDEEHRRKLLKIPMFRPGHPSINTFTIAKNERMNLAKLRDKVTDAATNVPDTQKIKLSDLPPFYDNLSFDPDAVRTDIEDAEADDESQHDESIHDELSEMSSTSLSDDETGYSEMIGPFKDVDDFVGWETEGINTQFFEVSNSYEKKVTLQKIKKAREKKAKDPGDIKQNDISQIRSFEYCGNLRDVTIYTRLIKRHNHNVSPVKGSVKIQSSSTVDNLCVMAVELIADPVSNSRVPDPASDPVMVLSCALCTDISNWTSKTPFSYIRSIVVRGGVSCGPTRDVDYVDSEMELFQKFAEIVQRFDPDILVGYDLHRESWTYLERRTSFTKHPLCKMISRVKDVSIFEKSGAGIDAGRIKLEVWKTARRDSPMRSYEFGYVVGQVLDLPFMELDFEMLKELSNSTNPDCKLLLVDICMKRAQYDIQILEKLDIFVKTSQMARVYGIQFIEVLTRGSQFRVESMLLRLARKRGMIPPSVGVKQRSLMGSPETIPLNLEPESGIYRDPVVVLDFQSLYPSVCIAYNYCFTTCLGKMSRLLNADLGDQIKLGALSYTSLTSDKLKELIDNDNIHISPTGGVFVKANVQKSMLAEMLMELLDTRVMVKDSMKNFKGDAILRRTLDAQQLALKLVANVTYGYTAANWSGRMPCEEVADAIVSKGREALEGVIHMVDGNAERYKHAEVIYGDTDSVFVLFRGCSRNEAFKLGRLIAEDVTKMNPNPMKLKFEKVMQPCILVTKKRYVGRSYEKEEDAGVFDAKGIETVRRDGSLFVSQMLEKCLNILFDFGQTAVIRYLQSKLANPESFPLSSFIINAEYRGEYAEKAQVPAKKLAMQRKEMCERFEPIRGERLPFVIIRPEPHSKTKMIDCVVGWEEFLKDSCLQLHYNYYMGKQLMSALTRFFDLTPYGLRYHSLYFDICQSCGKSTNDSEFCEDCSEDDNVDQIRLAKYFVLQRRLLRTYRSCKNCIKMDSVDIDVRNLKCFNFNCNINNTRLKLERNLENEDDIELNDDTATPSWEEKMRTLDEKWQIRLGQQVAYLRERIEKLETTMNSLNHVMESDWNHFGDQKFKFFDRNVDWNEAQVFCRLHNAQLINVDDSQKNKIISEFLTRADPAITEVWIDLKTQTQMETDSYKYDNFSEKGLIEGCTVVDIRGKWKIRPCSRQRPFICERK